jgi:membrane-associated phospholipid phosphatase
MTPWAGITRSYRFVDYATQIYLFLVGALILFFHNERVPNFQLLLLAHGAGILVIHAFIVGSARLPGNGVLSFFRHFYPLLLYAFLYRESEQLNLMFVNRYLDPVFITVEEWIFGFQPAVVFMSAFPHPVVSEFFYMSYFSYYVMIAGVGLALFFRNREQFWHYVAILSFVFYGCFLVFIFLPVAGPPAFYMEIPRFVDQHRLPYYPLEFPPGITSGPFFNLMKILYRFFESGGAAFPSSHVAAALCTLFFSWRYLTRVRHLILAATLALSFATVYCRYHYAVDVFAGAATAAVLIPVGEWLYRRY